MPSYSGRFVLRIPPTLHRTLADYANAHAISLNQACCDVLASGVRGTAPDPAWLRHAATPLRIAKRHFSDALLGVIAFGSQVRGDFRDDSDLDLLLVLRDDVPVERALYRWWDGAVPRNPAIEINPHFVHLPRAPAAAGSLWLEVALCYRILLQQGRALGAMIESLRELIRAGTVERAWIGGHAYWIRRSDAEPHIGG